MAEPMTHLSLFSGIGGIDLAAHWAGFRTVAFVERDPFCQKVLAKHWPGVPIHDDVTTFDGRAFRGIDLVSGGFPCQPHSVAGKRKASRDERDLWGELVRVLGETRPRWFLGENVPGLLSSESGRFFGRVVDDLASLGYRVGWGVWGAAHVGACHLRKRVFIVANRDDVRPQGGDEPYPNTSSLRRQGSSKRERGGEAGEGRMQESCARDARNSRECGRAGQPRGRSGEEPSHRYAPLRPRDWRSWNIEPLVRRGDDGVPKGLDKDRIRALGNAVVPQQVYPILKAIAEVMK